MILKQTKSLVIAFAFIAVVSGCTKQKHCVWTEGELFTGTFYYLDSVYQIYDYQINAVMKLDGLTGNVRFTGNIPKSFHCTDGVHALVVCEPVGNNIGIPVCYRIKCIERK